MRANRIRQSGITLIALVITIIVLLILAGVSIAMLTGQNGILIQAQNAGEETERTNEEERVRLAANGALLQNGGNDILQENLESELEEYFKEKDFSVISGTGNNGDDGYIVTITENIQEGRKYFVSKKGNVENKKELTPEEAAKITDGIVTDYGVLALTAGETVLFKENRTSYDSNIKEVDIKDAKIITKDGMRKKIRNCFIDNKGKVYTWGDNQYGQLGNGTYDDAYTPICISETQETLKEKIIINIYTNESNSTIIALDSEGKVYTWGNNYTNVLGDGTTSQNRNVPMCISDIGDSSLKGKYIKNIFMNDSMVVALDEEGKVYTWGMDYNGQLGNGTYASTNTPICINDIENSALKGEYIEEIDIQDRTVIAKNKAKEIFIWGEFIENDIINCPIAFQVEGISQITDICIDIDDYDNIILLDNEGKVYTWGNNNQGQLGNGTYKNSDEPICISEIEESALKDKKIDYIYIYRDSVIVKDEQGKLYTWGYDYSRTTRKRR